MARSDQKTVASAEPQPPKDTSAERSDPLKSKQFFGRRGMLNLNDDQSVHRRYASLYEDLLA